MFGFIPKGKSKYHYIFIDNWKLIICFCTSHLLRQHARYVGAVLIYILVELKISCREWK